MGEVSVESYYTPSIRIIFSVSYSLNSSLRLFPGADSPPFSEHPELSEQIEPHPVPSADSLVIQSFSLANVIPLTRMLLDPAGTFRLKN